MKSDILKEMLKDVDLDKIKKEQLEYKKSLTLAYQLGYYVGERISGRIPTLDVDMIQSDNVVKVNYEENRKHNELNERWSLAYNDKTVSKEEKDRLFKEFRDYSHSLEVKYFNPELSLSIDTLNVEESDMLEFKKGISKALWNCDFCSYDIKPENIEVKDDESLYFTLIYLKHIVD